MFYTITKKTFIIIIVIMLGLAMPIAIGITVTESSPKAQFMVVIDAGHGGIDEGVLGVTTKFPESDLNLAVAKLVKKYFETADINVVMTRSTKEGLYGIKSSGFKSRDMNNRKKIIEEAEPDIVLSIHMNYYSSPIRRGLQVFYSESGKSKDLADEIQNVANLNLNMPIIKRNLTELYGDYFICKCSDCPSVIVECGFLSNPLDEALLMSTDYQEELAYYIFTGVMNYINCNLSVENTN